MVDAFNIKNNTLFFTIYFIKIYFIIFMIITINIIINHHPT